MTPLYVALVGEIRHQFKCSLKNPCNYCNSWIWKSSCSFVITLMYSIWELQYWI